MNYTTPVKSFINSQYFYEGVRVTAGILIPALLMSYFGLLSTGILLSLGAMCVSVTDSAGPILHRRNGMLACLVSIFFVSLVVGFAASMPVLLAAVLFTFCFIFSMLGIYGTRAGAVGIASLLIMVLNIDQQLEGWQVIYHALYIASGGLWYLCFSILLYSVRPYKPVQQALGDSIESIADYLRLRAEFYKKDIDYNANYRRLLHQQSLVQDKQNTLSELLFKTRSTVKESTLTGRVLVMMYMDVADMYERIMTSYQYYSTLHEYFEEYNILEKFRDLALILANEIEEAGVAVKSGYPSDARSLVGKRIKETHLLLDELREKYMTPENIEGFLNLRRILENIEDIYSRVQNLHFYTTYDQSLGKKVQKESDFEHLISHQQISIGMLFDNLNFQSDTFRHALRVSIAVLVGYIGSLFFPFGHSYWILLTIVVILKPAYSLTKSRNVDRLLGTLIGALIGICVIYLVQNKTGLLFVMIFLMIGTYMFLRKNYFLSVLLMTPYIIIFFHLLNPAIFRSVLADRLIDTAIGSVIAYGASMFLFPAWERKNIRPAVILMLQQSIQYLHSVSLYVSQSQNYKNREQQLARKETMVALANLSDAFNRMLSEPRRMQKGIQDIHRFVVLCHSLTSYIATLSSFNHKIKNDELTAEFMNAISLLEDFLHNAVDVLQDNAAPAETKLIKEVLRTVNEKTSILLELRQAELQKGLGETETKARLIRVKSVTDQLNFIYNVTCDINKTVRTLVNVF